MGRRGPPGTDATAVVAGQNHLSPEAGGSLMRRCGAHWHRRRRCVLHQRARGLPWPVMLWAAAVNRVFPLPAQKAGRRDHIMVKERKLPG